jgi:hypothetical protein
MKKNEKECGSNGTACTLHNACGAIDTGCVVNAVSLIPHSKYDTACTIDE